MKRITTIIIALVALFCVGTINLGGNNIMVSEAQAREYTQVQAMHILVPTEQEAINIRTEIMTGKTQQEIFNNFMNAAKKYSKCPSGSSGGILGWFGKGDMVPAFEKAAFQLPNGEVSQPVKTKFGWHLIYDISKK